MGTDVHYVAEKQDEHGNWKQINIGWEGNRHYQLFAVLANVRNGRGFAGSKYGDMVEPISEPRDLPDDFPIVDDNYYGTELIPDVEENKRYGIDINNPIDDDLLVENVWMGDHSHTWLTSTEILEWFDRPHPSNTWLIIDKEAFVKVQNNGDYKEIGYSRFDDPSIKTLRMGPYRPLTEEEMNDTALERVEFSYQKDINAELDYFRELIQKAQDEHGEFRLVLGFDS